MKPQHLRYETEGTTAIITLDRPEASNAYSEGMVEALVGALQEADRDEQVRCIVLTGAGKVFSAGGDLRRMQERAGMFAGGSAELQRAYVLGIQQIPRAITACGTPIVAAVNGAAMGAGLDLACMCDIRIAAEGAKFASSFVRVGLIPGDGGAYLLARTIGFPRALEMILSARVVGTDEALRMGLVHEVVGLDQLMTAAKAKADELAEHPAWAVRLARRAAYRSWDADLDTALELAACYQGMAQRTDDHAEAVAAVLEKRAPRFTGR